MPDLNDVQRDSIRSMGLTVKVNRRTGVPRLMTGFTRPLEGLDDKERTLDFFRRHASIFRMKKPEQQVTFLRSDKDKMGNTCIRTQQTVGDGVKVFGSEMLIRLDAKRLPTHFVGQFFPGISHDFNTRPTVSVQDAQKKAAEHAKGNRVLKERGQEKWVLPMIKEPRLAYRMVVSGTIPIPDCTETSDQIIHKEIWGTWDYFVDARNDRGVLLRLSRNRMDGSRNAVTTGVGYYSESIDRLNVYYDADNEVYLLNDRTGDSGATICTCDALDTGGSEIAPVSSDSDGSWDAKIQAPLVDCHHYCGVVARYFRDRHGRKGVDGKGGEMRIWGNAPPDIRALYIGPHVLIGNGDYNRFNEFCTLDLIAHEWTHGFIMSCADTPYESWSGALEEGICDSFATFVKLYYQGNEDAPVDDDWQIAAKAWRWKMRAPSARNLKDPPNPGHGPTDVYVRERALLSAIRGHQPDHLDQAADPMDSDCRDDDFGGVHVNSGIFNKITFLLCKGGRFRDVECGNGLGVRIVERLYYDLVTSGLHNAYHPRGSAGEETQDEETVMNDDDIGGIPAEVELMRDLLLVAIDAVYGAKASTFDGRERELADSYVNWYKQTLNNVFAAIGAVSEEHPTVGFPKAPVDSISWPPDSEPKS